MLATAVALCEIPAYKFLDSAKTKAQIMTFCFNQDDFNKQAARHQLAWQTVVQLLGVDTVATNGRSI